MKKTASGGKQAKPVKVVGKKQSVSPLSRKKAVESPRPALKLARPVSPAEDSAKILLAAIDDWRQAGKPAKEKQKGLQIVQEFINNREKSLKYIPAVIPEIFLIIEASIFRSFSANNQRAEKITYAELGANIESFAESPEWTVLKEVYLVFSMLINSESLESKHFKALLTDRFFCDFLQLFDTEIDQEREFLQIILTNLYKKMIPKRNLIRKSLNNRLLLLIQENQSINGIESLLKVYSYIISCFSIPLRLENIELFRKIIIPLHKLTNSEIFLDQLQQCVVLYLSKDLNLAYEIVEALLKYWPIGNSNKELYFLATLQEAIKVCEVKKLENYVQRIVKRIVKCLVGSHLQVATKAKQLSQDEYLLMIFLEFKRQVFEIVAPLELVFEENNFNKEVFAHFSAFKEDLKSIDSRLFEEIRSNSKKIINAYGSFADNERVVVESKWDALIARAKCINPALSFSVPFTYK